MPALRRARARITSSVWASIHPVWQRCSSFPYRGVCAVPAPCQTGVSAPKQRKLFLREPSPVNSFHHSHLTALKFARCVWPFWAKNVTLLRDTMRVRGFNWFWAKDVNLWKPDDVDESQTGGWRFPDLRLPREPRRSGRMDSHLMGDGPLQVMIVFRMKPASGLGGMLRS